MSMMINTNVASLNAQRMVGSAVRDQATAMERLSSGQRINSAADDAAGLGIANSMTSQIRGLDQAVRNANDGMSMIQAAEGALQQTTNILQRMRELAVQSANGTYNDSENRASLDAEFKQLVAEIDRIADNTEFNGVTLLNGDQKNGVDLQVGSGSNQTIGFSIDAMDAKNLGLGSTSVDTVGVANSWSASTVSYNDVLINGQSIIKAGQDAFDGSSDTDDVLINAINENINGVSASMIGTVEIAITGDSNISAAEELTVALTKTDGTVQSFKIRDASSMDEIVSKLNDAANGAFSASVNDAGKFEISAEGVSQIVFTDAGSAIGSSSTVQGKLALTSDNGDPITVERGSTGTFTDLTVLGFRESTDAGTIEGGGISSPTAAWGVGDVNINGVAIHEGITAGATLMTKVDAINDVSDQTGVRAEAFVSAELNVSGVNWSAAAANLLEINGVAIASSTTNATLVTAINAKTGQTGITATLSGDTIKLEGNASALNIDILTSGSGSLTAATVQSIQGNSVAAAATLSSSSTINGGLKLTSETGNPISIDLGTAATVGEHGLLESNAVSGGAGGTAVNTLSVDSASNAQSAIDVLDDALSQVNQQRGQLGAVSNRLEFTVDNLQSISQNTAAARSRILDADFASESAALSKSQVLQQAATAMLAQANSAPQQVLSLLR